MFPARKGTMLSAPSGGGALDRSWVSKGLVGVYFQNNWITQFGSRPVTPSNGQVGRVVSRYGRVNGFGTTDAGNTTAAHIGGVLENSIATGRTVFIRAFMRSTGGGTFGRVFQDSTGDGTATGSTGAWIANGGLGLYMRTSGTAWQEYTTTLPTNQWFTAAMACNTQRAPTDSNVGSGWVNGRRITTTANTSPTGTFNSTSSTTLMFGNRADGTRNWDGQLDVVLIFDTVLTDFDVQLLHADPYRVFNVNPQFIPLVLPTVTEAVFPIRRGQQLSQVNTSNTETDTTYNTGVAFLFSAPHGTGEVLSKGKVKPFSQSGVKSAGRNGVSLKASSGKPASWDVRPFTTSTGDGLGDYTFVYRGNPAAAASRYAMLSQDINTGNSGQTYLMANTQANGALSIQSGSVGFHTYDATNGYAGVALANSCDGNVHTWIGIRRGNTLELWRDGVLQASGSALGDISGTKVVINEASQVVTVGALGAYTGFDSPADHYLAFGYNRALSAGEARELSRDPYKLFERIKARVGINLAAGAVQYIKDLVSSLSISGAITKSTSKRFGGSLTLAGALAATKTFIRALGGSITAAGSLAKSTAKSVAGSITKVGSVIKSTAKRFTGSTTVSATPVVGMGASANLSGSITLSSVLSDAVTFVRNYGSQIVLSGGMAKAISKRIARTLTLTGAAFKGMFKAFTGSISASSILGSFKFTPQPGGALARGMRFMRRFIGRR